MFRIPGGKLEGILSEASERRAHLVWKNFWYSAMRRRRIAGFPARIATHTPMHFLRPEVYPILKELVRFEKEVHEYFKNLSLNGPTTTV